MMISYLTIKIGQETFSDTFLDTLPKPLKNFETPLRPNTNRLASLTDLNHSLINAVIPSYAVAFS